MSFEYTNIVLPTSKNMFDKDVWTRKRPIWDPDLKSKMPAEHKTIQAPKDKAVGPPEKRFQDAKRFAFLFQKSWPSKLWGRLWTIILERTWEDLVLLNIGTLRLVFPIQGMAFKNLSEHVTLWRCVFHYSEFDSAILTLWKRLLLWPCM